MNKPKLFDATGKEIIWEYSNMSIELPNKHLSTPLDKIVENLKLK